MIKKLEAFVRAPGSLIGLNGPDQLHLGPHSHPLCPHAAGSFKLQLVTQPLP